MNAASQGFRLRASSAWRQHLGGRSSSLPGVRGGCGGATCPQKSSTSCARGENVRTSDRRWGERRTPRRAGRSFFLRTGRVAVRKMAEKALREVHLEVTVAAADRLEQPARFVGAQLGRVAPGLEGGQKVGGRRGGFSHQADDPFTRSSTRSPPRSPRRSSMWPSNACAPHVIVVGSLAPAVSPPGLRAEADQREMDLFRGLAEWPPRMMVSCC